MRILVCGSREWDDRNLIHDLLTGLCWGSRDAANERDFSLIHGAARGADSVAAEFAEESGAPVQVFPADWLDHNHEFCRCREGDKSGRYCKAAGPRRNKQMLEEGKPDLVMAFFKRGAGNRGTQNMVDLARKAGVRVVEVWA